MMISPACAVTVPRPVCESSCWTSKEEHETSRDPRARAKTRGDWTSLRPSSAAQAGLVVSVVSKLLAPPPPPAGADSGSLAGEIAPRRA